MKISRVFRRTSLALSLIGAISLACFLGPVFLGEGPPPDPVHGVLLPPGSRLLRLSMRDGKEITISSWIKEDDGLEFLDESGATRRIAEGQIQSRESSFFLLGTDRFGRDLLRLMLNGGRISLGIAFSASFLALFLGLGTGLSSIAGPEILGGVLMRSVDALLAFPSLLLLILAAAVFSPGPLTLILLLGSTSWMGLARLVRGQALAIRKREYILAARLAGSPWYRVWLWHYLPGLRGPVAQDTALRVGDLILAEATLSYLGLGLPSTMPTWGRLVNEGHRVLGEAWWVSVFPGLAISLLVIAFALLGDALQQPDDAS